ncbi:MAG TPA: sporulation protein [Bacillaceae bacterium]
MVKRLAAAAAAAILLTQVAGCSGKEHDKSESALIKTTRPSPIELKSRPEDKSVAYRVRKEVNQINEIYDAAVIEGEKEVIVAYKVRHLQRFKMKKIEKDLTEKLNKKYPEDQFIVSSDYKIFLESIRLREDLDHKNLSQEDAEKRFKKIIQLKKEMT